jgi:hypothetical protein
MEISAGQMLSVPQNPVAALHIAVGIIVLEKLEFVAAIQTSNTLTLKLELASIGNSETNALTTSAVEIHP